MLQLINKNELENITKNKPNINELKEEKERNMLLINKHKNEITECEKKIECINNKLENDETELEKILHLIMEKKSMVKNLFCIEKITEKINEKNELYDEIKKK